MPIRGTLLSRTGAPSPGPPTSARGPPLPNNCFSAPTGPLSIPGLSTSLARLSRSISCPLRPKPGLSTSRGGPPGISIWRPTLPNPCLPISLGGPPCRNPGLSTSNGTLSLDWAASSEGPHLPKAGLVSLPGPPLPNPGLSASRGAPPLPKSRTSPSLGMPPLLKPPGMSGSLNNPLRPKPGAPASL